MLHLHYHSLGRQGLGGGGGGCHSPIPLVLWLTETREVFWDKLRMNLSFSGIYFWVFFGSISKPMGEEELQTRHIGKRSTRLQGEVTFGVVMSWKARGYEVPEIVKKRMIFCHCLCDLPTVGFQNCFDNHLRYSTFLKNITKFAGFTNILWSSRLYCSFKSVYN